MKKIEKILIALGIIFLNLYLFQKVSHFESLNRLKVISPFVLISLTSVLVSLYAGDDFVWFRVMNSS